MKDQLMKSMIRLVSEKKGSVSILLNEKQTLYVGLHFDNSNLYASEKNIFKFKVLERITYYQICL